MDLSDDDVRHVAKLGALEIADSELETIKNQLNEILGYVATLQTIPSSGIEPTSHIHGAQNFFRDDIIKQSLPTEELEKNAPDWLDSFYKVPRII